MTTRSADHLGTLAKKTRETASVLQFGAEVLWRASPFLCVGLLALSWVGGLTPVVQIWATAHLIDSLVQGVHRGAVGAGVASPTPLATLGPFLPWIGALVGALVVKNTASALAPLMSAHMRERVSGTLERRLYQKAMALGLVAFESPEYYDHLERARRAVQGGAVTLILVWLGRFLSRAVGAAGILAVIARVSWPLALVLMLGSIPLGLETVRQQQSFDQINYAQSPLKRKLAYWRDLSVKREPAAELRLFNLGSYFLDRWRSLNDRLVQELFAVRRHYALRSLRLTLGTGLLSAVVVGALAFEAAHSTISAGVLVAMLYALNQFEEFRTTLAYQVEGLQSSGIQFGYVPAFLKMPGDERAVGAPASTPLREGISVENLTFFYPSAKQPALREVSLSIRPGERLALVGENGAGKSTLARLLMGLYNPTTGRILVDGADLRDLDPACWRAGWAAVFQNYVRYQLAARENVGFGDVRRLGDLEGIIEAARQSGAHAAIRQLPLSYEAVLGKGFSGAHDLSTGQWQKLALARAYFRDASLLVLDEPAASLDALAEQEVYRQFSQASAGKTLVLISHRLGSARLADRIVVLEQGRIAQVGSHSELIAAGGPYAEMYQLQAEWYREATTEDRCPGEPSGRLSTSG